MIEKFRARIFAVSNLTVAGTTTLSGAVTLAGVTTFSGSVVNSGSATNSGTVTFTGKVNLPYGTAAPTFAANGGVAVATVSNASRLSFQSGGSVYTLQMPTVSNGTITITVA